MAVGLIILVVKVSGRFRVWQEVRGTREPLLLPKFLVHCSNPTALDGQTSRKTNDFVLTTTSRTTYDGRTGPFQRLLKNLGKITSFGAQKLPLQTAKTGLAERKWALQTAGMGFAERK